ncbi:MAG TPA: PIG-L family deacetylase [Armatimonadota bacterium]|nr:PIG-L family deacetylase [Armatimonadota bacterium]
MNGSNPEPRGVVFALAAHPDDIDMMMAGTMLRLRSVGYELHYMTIGNGSCGTAVHTKDEIIRIRTAEARAAAHMIGAIYHEPLVDDIDIFYDKPLLARVGAVMRDVRPDILLLQSPQDYMEDHMNSSRLGVTAAFCRGMRNFPTDPPRPVFEKEVAVYHALPWGLCDQLRTPILPHFYVDVADVMAQKRDMLACHKSQKEWLDVSQGLDSYLIAMEDMCAQVGAMSGRFASAEGWRRHSHLGFSAPGFDPMSDALGEWIEPHRPV